MYRRIRLMLALAMVLVLLPAGAVLADGLAEPVAVPEGPPDPEDSGSGEVWQRVESQLPGVAPVGGIAPCSVNPVPGGGYAWAEVGLSWWYYFGVGAMHGIGRTGLSNEVTGSYHVSAYVAGLYRDGVWKGSDGPDQGWCSGGCLKQADKTHSGQITGYLWRANTNHLVTNYVTYTWPVALEMSVQL
mgnify:CR=1 FL=1